METLAIDAGHAVESSQRSIDAIVFELDVERYVVGVTLFVFGNLGSDTGYAGRFDELYLSGLERGAARDRGGDYRNLCAGNKVESISIGNDSEWARLNVDDALLLGQR